MNQAASEVAAPAFRTAREDCRGFLGRNGFELTPAFAGVVAVAGPNRMAARIKRKFRGRSTLESPLCATRWARRLPAPLCEHGADVKSARATPLASARLSSNQAV